MATAALIVAVLLALLALCMIPDGPYGDGRLARWCGAAAVLIAAAAIIAR
jgi:hypothetical protein